MVLHTKGKWSCKAKHLATWPIALTLRMASCLNMSCLTPLSSCESSVSTVLTTSFKCWNIMWLFEWKKASLPFTFSFACQFEDSNPSCIILSTCNVCNWHRLSISCLQSIGLKASSTPPRSNWPSTHAQQTNSKSSVSRSHKLKFLVTDLHTPPCKSPTVNFLGFFHTLVLPISEHAVNASLTLCA